MPSQESSRFYYTVNNQTITNIEANGKEIENKSTSDIGMTYEIEPRDSNGNTPIKVTFDKFSTKIKNKDIETDIDADNASNSLDPIEKFIAGIKGSSITIIVNKKGEITSEAGIQASTDSLLNKMDLDVATQQQLQVQVSKLMGDNFIKNNLVQTSNLLPDTAVYEGDSWTKKEIIKSGDFEFNVVTKYTLVSVENDLVNLETASDINNADNNGAVAFGGNATAELKGTQKVN